MCASTRFVRFALPLVTVVGSVAGCATPGPIVRLDPRTPDRVVWVAGRAVLETEQAGVRVAAAFEHQESAGLGVRIEIENGTAAPFEVGPAGITFMTCKSLDNATCDGSWSVVDPESMLEDLDQAQSRTVANATNQAAFDTTLVLLNAVGDVGTVASGRADATTGLGTVAAANNAEANL